VSVRECPCPRAMRGGPYPPEYRVNPGPTMTRIETDPHCRIHNEHRYVGDGTEPCRFCGLKRLYWSAHTDVRREMMGRLRR
jgi:hypothetical protein